ncbi:hypothetical protein [Alicyclobacillus fodiniaquatilis]|uniref:Uncharacterized protein n=1 Tax=Alicyclobacillus fodiniaquatilis TaxID=1661150 RepID=A0ABW4JJA9_9BACL
MLQKVKRLVISKSISVCERTLRGDLPEMTGKAWLFVAIIVGVVLIFGPMALHIVTNALGGSTNTINNNFNLVQ